MNTKKHDRIQLAIVETFKQLGIEARQEFSGKDWRADVFVKNIEKPIAFEIQITPQTLKRTLERQSKYIRDGINGCWLFERPVRKLTYERPDLPVFYVEEKGESEFWVNLGDRRKVTLHSFLESYISNRIQFKPIIVTKKSQIVSLVFYEMICWKCNAMNHLYFVESSFYSSCNAVIEPDETLWESVNIEYRPEIVALAESFVKNREDLGLSLGKIKERYSNTVDRSYMSFGCHKCDSLFGDFFVMEAKIDLKYCEHQITHKGEIELSENIEINLPHWCFPHGSHFCGEHIG